MSFPSPSTQPNHPLRAPRMGRRRSQRACATTPSMLSSARGVPELHRSAAEAEVSAAAAGATGSEVAGPADRGTDGGGRGPAATTSSAGVAERAEQLGDAPARKPDPEPGRMDHHQLGTGRYQVVSFWSPPRPPRSPGLSPAVAPGVSVLRLIPTGTYWLPHPHPLLAGPDSFTSPAEPASDSFETLRNRPFS